MSQESCYFKKRQAKQNQTKFNFNNIILDFSDNIYDLIFHFFSSYISQLFL